MSQNALQIPTTSPLPGLTMVNDANAALAALATILSGASAPTTAATGLGSTGGLLWHDTGNNLLKLRDQADSTWMALPLAINEMAKTVTLSGSASGLSGALLSANNLSDLASAATAWSNLGGGAAGKLGVGGNLSSSGGNLIAPFGLTTIAATQSGAFNASGFTLYPIGATLTATLPATTSGLSGQLIGFYFTGSGYNLTVGVGSGSGDSFATVATPSSLFIQGYAFDWLILMGDATNKYWHVVSASPNVMQQLSMNSNVPLGVITGFLPSALEGTSTTATISISAGVATDATGFILINSQGNGFSWAVSNGNAANGYQGGTTLPTSTTVHFFVMQGTAGTASFASASLSPTLPSGYSRYRRIFSFWLPSGGWGALNNIAAEEDSGGAARIYWQGRFQDVSVTNLGTSSVLYALSVPTGVKVRPIISAAVTNNSNVILTSPDEADQAPASAFGTAPGYDLNGAANQTNAFIDGLFTNTSGQLRARANGASTPFYIYTRGWIDPRRN